jgi:hypothetical protein
MVVWVRPNLLEIARVFGKQGLEEESVRLELVEERPSDDWVQDETSVDKEGHEEAEHGA